MQIKRLLEKKIAPLSRKNFSLKAETKGKNPPISPKYAVKLLRTKGFSAGEDSLGTVAINTTGNVAAHPRSYICRLGGFSMLMIRVLVGRVVGSDFACCSPSTTKKKTRVRC